MLRRVAPVPDEIALERLLKHDEVTRYLVRPSDIDQLWQVCQIPDFRNLGPEAHARLLEDIFITLNENDGQFPNDYLERNIKRLEIIEGGTDILSSRLSSIRTWTYIAHKPAWVKNCNDWINRTRQVEDNLSDALHEKLVLRFVDRRTSALLKGIGANTRMDATVTEAGEVIAEGHTIGHLEGLLFVPDATTTDVEAKTLQKTALLSLAPEIDRRLTQISGCNQDAFKLSDGGEILWDSSPIAKLIAGNELLKPRLELVGGKLGNPVLCDLAIGRVRDFLTNEINQKFESLFALKSMAEDPQSFQGARALASVLFENYGVIQRRHHVQLIKDTDKVARGYLRNKSAKFGFYHVFLRDLMKPAPARLMSLLFAYAWNKDGGGDRTPFLPPNGMSSTPDDPKYSELALNKAGYTRCGPRIVRLDILSRLAELILQAKGSRDKKHFRIAQEMLSLLGCTYEEMQQVLETLGFSRQTVEMSPEELETETQRIMAVHERQSGKDAKEPIMKPEMDKAPTPEANAEAVEKAEVKPAKPEIKDVPYVPKRQRVKPIHDYVAKPDLDETGMPIIKSTIEIWGRRPKQKYNRRPQDGRNQERSGAGRGQKDQNQTDGKSISSSSGRHKNNKSGNQNRKKQWTSGPGSRNKGMKAEDSPFAALADLKIPAREKRRQNKKDKDG
jgi:ATP-dependent RNA helicase SUPV3L1/SUV3